jgi:hypothetical protein
MEPIDPLAVRCVDEKARVTTPYKSAVMLDISGRSKPQYHRLMINGKYFEELLNVIEGTLEIHFYPKELIHDEFKHKAISDTILGEGESFSVPHYQLHSLIGDNTQVHAQFTVDPWEPIFEPDFDTESDGRRALIRETSLIRRSEFAKLTEEFDYTFMPVGSFCGK